MLEKGKISARQFQLLVALYILGSSILFFPSMLASEAKQDAWISAIIAVGTGLLVILLYNALGKRFPQMNVAQYCEHILGKWIGKTLSLLYFISFPFLISALMVRNVGEFMTTQMMPETPIQAIHIILMVVVIIGVRLGLESLSRSAEIFFPFVILLFLILVLSSTPNIELKNIQPVFEGGMKPIVRSVIPAISFPFLDVVNLLMIFPYVNRTEKAGSAFFIGTLIGGIILIITVSLTILVLGTDPTARHIYPSYTLTRKINVANFFQRVEALMALLWFISMYFRLTIMFYVSVLGIAQTLNLKDYRLLTFPLGMIVLVLSIVVFPNITYNIAIFPIWANYALTWGLLFPLLLLVVDIFRKKGESGPRKTGKPEL